MDGWRAWSPGRIVDGWMDGVVDEWIRPQSPDRNGGQMDVDADGIGGSLDR